MKKFLITLLIFFILLTAGATFVICNYNTLFPQVNEEVGNNELEVYFENDKIEF